MFFRIGASSGGAPIQRFHDCAVVPVHPQMIQDFVFVWIHTCIYAIMDAYK